MVLPLVRVCDLLRHREEATVWIAGVADEPFSVLEEVEELDIPVRMKERFEGVDDRPFHLGRGPPPGRRQGGG